MKIGIVEDEKTIAQELIDVLNTWLYANKYADSLIMHFYTGEELLKKYQQEHVEFEIIFIDIKLEGINGLDTAENLRKLGYSKAIVFISNHKDYEFVQKGYDVDAINYYAKPITFDNVDSSMRKLNIGKIHNYYFNSTMYSLAYNEIAYFETKRNYIFIHPSKSPLENAKYKGSLADIIKQSPKSFVQVHRSYVINISQVTKIEGRNIFIRTYSGIVELHIGDKFFKDVLSALQYL